MHLGLADERLTARQTGALLSTKYTAGQQKANAAKVKAQQPAAVARQWQWQWQWQQQDASSANWQVAEQADTYLKSIEPKSTFTPTDDLNCT